MVVKSYGHGVAGGGHPPHVPSLPEPQSVIVPRRERVAILAHGRDELAFASLQSTEVDDLPVACIRANR